MQYCCNLYILTLSKITLHQQSQKGFWGCYILLFSKYIFFNFFSNTYLIDQAVLQQFLYLHFAKAIPGTEWNYSLTTKPITITSIFGWIITFKVHFTFPKILVSWCWIVNKLAKDRGLLRKIRTTAGNKGIRIRALLKRMRPEGGKGIC